MYPEYEKVQSFFNSAAKLKETNQEMKDLFESIYTRNKNNLAAIYISENGHTKKASYRSVEKQIYMGAATLHSLVRGEKGNVIILKVGNCKQWGECFWSILMSGYKPLLLDAKTSKDGTANIIKQSKAVAIISDDPYRYEIQKFDLDDFMDLEKDDSFKPEWENEVIFCSSGTTGDVKLMVYNGKNIIAQVCASLDMPATTKDIMYPKCMGKVRILAMIPFHHIFGFVAVFLWYTFYGKTIVYPPSLMPSELFSMCQKTGVTHVYSVPLFWDSLALGLERKTALLPENKQLMLQKLVDYNLGKIDKKEAGPVDLIKKVTLKKLLGNKLRFCISGGGYLNNKAQELINGIGYPLYNGFGMTEVGVTSVELSPDVNVRLKASIGKPLHGIEYKIDNPGPDGQGELLIKSDITHIREIIGGVEKPATIDNDGFFHSGDIAFKDEDGEYYIKGRIKDIIVNANGENIFPDELELFFKGLEHVNHYSILGIDKAKSTNQDVALVLEVDNSIREEEIQKLIDKIHEIAKGLPHKTTIDKIYFSKGKLPLANNMKVKRFLIKKAIEANTGEYVEFGTKQEQKESVVFDKETTANILIPVKELFSKVLVLPIFKIENDSHWINDLGGDSMNYVELCRDINDEFDVVIPEEDYGQLTCINDFVKEIIKLKNEK